jgi:hypothetical protein
VLARLWAAGAGPADPAGALTIDVDSTICEVYGRGKQGAGFGATLVRGYHPQLATLAETGQVIFSRLRGGSAGAARGAKSFLTETVSRLRDAGASGPLTVRADSAFYSRAMLTTAAKFDVRFPGHRPAGQANQGRDRGDPRRRLDPDPILALDPGGLRRRRRRARGGKTGWRGLEGGRSNQTQSDPERPRERRAAMACRSWEGPS